MNAMQHYVFGYGSLMCLKSAARALKRELTVKDVSTVILDNYIREWILKEDVFFVKQRKQSMGVFLDISHVPGKMVNGILIPVSKGELCNLKAREKNYLCIDVSSDIRECPLGSKVFTFQAKEDHLITGLENNAYIPGKYIEMVENACMEYGMEFYDNYRETTIQSTISVMNGEYEFIDLNQSQYT